MKSTKEIVDEWREVYMNWIWLVSIEEFFSFIASIKETFESIYHDTPYDLVCSYIIPLCSPKFIENEPTKELQTWPTESK